MNTENETICSTGVAVAEALSALSLLLLHFNTHTRVLL